MKPTTTLFNRLDPRQPSEAEVHAAAEAAVEQFGGDVGRAAYWAREEAIRFERESDRARNVTAVRLLRAIKARMKSGMMR